MIEDLTNKEKSIYKLQLKGWKCSSIADKLDCTAKTIENYTDVIYKKMGVYNKYELIIKYYEGVVKELRENVQIATNLQNMIKENALGVNMMRLNQ